MIESHHAADAEGEPAIIRLADMLAHYLLGEPVTPSEMLNVARSINLKSAQLRQIMYDLPLSNGASRPRQVDPCPMSARELDVLKRLAQGMVYKQIASELGALDQHRAHPSAQRVRQAWARWIAPRRC